MAKFFITAPIDYIMGYLKYGHFEGEIEVPDSEIENFKANPVDWIEEHDKEERTEYKCYGYSVQVDW